MSRSHPFTAFVLACLHMLQTMKTAANCAYAYHSDSGQLMVLHVHCVLLLAACNLVHACTSLHLSNMYM